MKAASDFLAIILFFATYLATKNMVWATAVAVVIGVLQAAFLYWKNRRLETMQWVSLVLIVGFGGATIVFRDGAFFMLKTTVLFWLMALVMLATQLMGRNGLKLLLAKELQLPEAVWNRLGYAWIVFFVLMGALNLYIAYPFTPDREEVWVNFKFYAYIPLMLVFSLAQGVYIYRYLKEEK